MNMREGILLELEQAIAYNQKGIEVKVHKVTFDRETAEGRNLEESPADLAVDHEGIAVSKSEA